MNILWVALDTQRADHLSCYGYPRKTSPSLDALAAEGVLFESYISSSAHTTPAFTSMFTGQEPFHHGVIATLHASDNEPHMRLRGETLTLAEVLYAQGWVTCAFDNQLHFRAHPEWMARGYRYYVNLTAPNASPAAPACEDINAELIPWLRRLDRERDNFVFVHYWDPHQRYNPPEPFLGTFDRSLSDLTEIAAPDGQPWLLGAGPKAPLEADELARESVCRHNEELLRVDAAVGQVVEALRDEGLYDDTLIIVNADHGDDMAEHNSNFEHREPYDCCTHLPLILKPAAAMAEVQAAGSRVSALVSHADLMPTVLEAAGIEYRLGPMQRSFQPLILDLDGASVLPLVRGQDEATRDNVVSVGCFLRYDDLYRCVEVAARDPRHRLLIRSPVPPGPYQPVECTGMTRARRRPSDVLTFNTLPRAELLDVANDPTETDDRLAAEPQIARRLYDVLLPCMRSPLFLGEPPGLGELMAGL
jgi:arylsulfatase